MTGRTGFPWRWLLLLLLPVALLAWGLYLSVPPEPPLAGQLLEGELEWEGRQRTYTYYVPSTRAERSPVVLVFHGSMGDAAQARAAFGYAFEVLAEEEGFLVAYPEGFEGHFNGCRKAGPYSANTLGVDDVGFMAALIERLDAELGVAHGAVYATGLSNGGQMALRLALEAPTLVAGVGVVATSMPAARNMDCRPSGVAVPFLLMNGTADPMNPYEGGTVALYGLFGNRGEVLSSRETVDYWADLAGYTRGPREFPLNDLTPGDGSTVTLSLWAGPGRVPVALYRVEGGGHSAPNPEIHMPRLLGGSNRDIYAAQHIWAFFRGAGPAD